MSSHYESMSYHLIKPKPSRTQVPGSQLVAMELLELEQDLEMSTLQAKRVLVNINKAAAVRGTGMETRTWSEVTGWLKSLDIAQSPLDIVVEEKVRACQLSLRHD
jgi:hypothetical protein